MDAMPLLQPPTASAFDAISSILSAAVYMIVALAALARAPHDARVRVFVAIAATGLTPYLMNAVIWRQGTEAVLSKAFVLAPRWPSAAWRYCISRRCFPGGGHGFGRTPHGCGLDTQS